MIKICSIAFSNHPVLGNLELDFCNQDGQPADTVILAGENGVGKSTVLDCLYMLVARERQHYFTASVIFDIDGVKSQLNYYYRSLGSGMAMFVHEGSGANSDRDELLTSSRVQSKYPTSGIFADVDITFHGSPVSAVSSMTLDEVQNSRRSTENQATMVNQLIVDIQALDDGDISLAVRSNPGVPFEELNIDTRMSRFTTAFSRMFDHLAYHRVETRNGHKEIIFQKDAQDIPLSNLSSGEKQIVYRGCFLLKDSQAMKGAFVFLDEPEISLHPSWQEKIMDYYKMIFTDNSGCQTSQIFAVTHSPFIIHSKARRNDKIIVLARDGKGKIYAIDKPEYYKCDALEAIEDAFSIRDFAPQGKVAYVAGRTDEMYLNRALDVFAGDAAAFRFKWVGRIDENGQERNTGDSALNKAEDFLIAQKLSYKTACLYDCDTQHRKYAKDNFICLTIPYCDDNSKNMHKGIENALILDCIDIQGFYSSKETFGAYGERRIVEELNKMKLCTYICNLSRDELSVVFKNLEQPIEELNAFFHDE